MNREIKFRAWHKALKKMFEPEELGKDQLTLSVDGRGFINVNGGSAELSKFYTNMIPLQFTGLTDKNGKDIYVGDICRAMAGNGIEPNVEIAEIVEMDAYYTWCGAVMGCDELCQEDMILEVIGNIYKNPELIHTKQLQL